MPTLRDLDWPDCLNVRDLGGLSVSGGGSTRFGVVVRSDHPSNLTPAGWDELWDYGIRTVISLETETADADLYAAVNPPLELGAHRAGLNHLRFRIDDVNDAQFKAVWAETGLWATPLYFAEVIARWPQRLAALVRHLAHCGPGGVLLHCSQGCDRTGLASYVLLTLAGVPAPDIAADYALSIERLAGRDPDHEHLQETLDARGRSVDEVFADLPTSVDLEQRLLASGVSGAELATVRERMLTPA
jgi:protein-tyrosine phosphatase